MKEWLIKRDSFDTYNPIFKKPHLNDQEYFRRYLRINTGENEVTFYVSFTFIRDKVLPTFRSFVNL